MEARTAARAAPAAIAARGRARIRPWTRPRSAADEPNRWLMLFVTTRLAAMVVAVLALLAHQVTAAYDPLLVGVAILYGSATTIVATRWERVQNSPLLWVLDSAGALTLVLAASEWRSPFYLLALTSLVLPAGSLPSRRALGYGFLFTLAYFGISVITGIDWETLDTSARLESLLTHLMVPMLVTLALAYASDLLGRLQEERQRSERLAIEAERRRIGWELHDSAKQRVHASHLVLSSLGSRLGSQAAGAGVEQAMGELRAAIADMETSVSELRAPLGSQGLVESLRSRASELASAGDVRVEVEGELPELAPFVAAHAFRVATEAMINAVRHAEASQIDVRLDDGDGLLRVSVIDDGRGIPARARPGSHGMRSMQARAERLGGRLEVRSGEEAESGVGTAVLLEVPLDREYDERP